MEDPEYKLNEVDEDEIKLPKINSSNGKKLTIILVGIIIFLFLVIITLVILYFIVLKKDEEENKGESKEEILHIYLDVQTGKNKTIKNTFGIGGDNYKKELGDINNGSNYESNDRNNFDLLIPERILKNNKNYTTIVLHIHGGGWRAGNKKSVEIIYKESQFKNFIIAAMSHTLLNEKYNQSNLFRILDEINATLETLKNFLINKGFDENKLELILIGGSSGAHLCLLYSYMYKNHPLPIKFVINEVGPVTLNPDFFFQTKPDDPPLDNITSADIDKALKENKLIRMNGSYTEVMTNNTILMYFMNVWLGNPGHDSFDEIFSNIETGELNTSNEKYKELLNKTSYGYPITYVTKETIPTLCVYGGKDYIDGVMQYSLLQKAYERNNNQNISLVYFKYGTHDAFENAVGEYGEKIIAKYNGEIQRYFQKYLDSYNKNT